MKVTAMHQKLRNTVGVLLGVAFAAIGVMHFVTPERFNEIVPAYLGIPWFWTYASGVGEICLGAGLMLPKARPWAGRWLVVLVLLMSLANLNMWINDIPFNGNLLSTTGHVIRWIIQAVLILVLLWLAEILPRQNRDQSAEVT